ncbi:unnamed protein product [Phyllotreta striolata]|uniref:PHD and RING finger domain-containing protein 1 n=1 Tax=Phyllotreta striolata TaxID=444603 RepID=A0A9N9TXK0_PHYSR|nr:unnamed protein product [Phyllotreta striolata]
MDSSSNSDDSDTGPKRKRKVRVLDDSSSSSDGSPIIGSGYSRTRTRRLRIPSDSDSSSTTSSSGSPVLNRFKKKRVRLSDSESDSSDSEVGRVRLKRCRQIESSDEWETDYSDNEATRNNSDTDSSDGRLEKCPICLVSFKSQEIGTPQSCDHSFCLKCIQEWSKTNNTCPVDRQEYHSILVRDRLDGKVTRRISIEAPAQHHETVEDLTACEVCGLTNQEDRMLLCDNCDAGYHMFCLTPPLDVIPDGAWFCDECSTVQTIHLGFDFFEFFFGDFNAEDTRPLRGSTPRLFRVPRATQSERIRRRTVRNVQENSITRQQPSNSAPSTSTRRKKKRKTRKTRRAVKYKTVYVIDETTGETVARKQRVKQRRRKRNARRLTNAAPTTTKKRLAEQLGMCAPKTPGQAIPDVRVPSARGIPANAINSMRHTAGVPTLHLFGRNDDVDFFEDDDDAHMDGGSQYLVRRAPNQNDVAAFRRAIRRKNIVVPEAVSSTSNLLDSIMSSQERLFAQNASYSVDSTGRFQIEIKKSKPINVTKQQASAKETPYYPNNNNNGNRNQNNRYNQNYRYNQYRYQNQRQSDNYYQSNQNYYSEPSSSMNYGGYSNDDGPQDYSQRTLCATSESNNDNEDETRANSESEVDIYSDIETVSTSKAEENDPKPSSSPPLPPHHAGTDDDNNDSEPEMVIDDDKPQEQDAQNDSNREETAVSSTVDHFERASEPAPIDSTSLVIQSEAIQSSSLDDNKPYQYYNEDSSDAAKEQPTRRDDGDDSDDGCPNFSIYSKESKTLAIHTDVGLSDRSCDQQVGEVSSSPNIDAHPTPIDAQEGYDPAGIYDQSDKEDSAEIDISQSYDPEKIYDEEDSDSYGRKISSSIDAKTVLKGGVVGGLYSDSEDDSVVKKHVISDINRMTEDISEEERSYTPCLDEKGDKQGLEGLDTELISDEDRDDFDESHDVKTASDGDALEINAKESELDFTRPEDYEEGEIVDKNKAKNAGKAEEKKPKKKDKPDDKSGNKENESAKDSSFKKLSKNNKERNYRDKEKRPKSKSKERDADKNKEKKKEARKELERYNVRAIIAEKPRPLVAKDQFGRDIRNTSSRSRSRSYTPPITRRSSSRGRSRSRSRGRRSRSRSRRRKSPSPAKIAKRRKSKTLKTRSESKSRSRSKSRSKSPAKKNVAQKSKKRKRSTSRYKRKSRDRSKNKKRSSRRRSTSASRKSREWEKREWTPASPGSPATRVSPSWTPPRRIDTTAQLLRNESLTVTVNNSAKKKRDKKRKGEKRAKDSTEGRPKKRRHDRERTPPLSKEVFASGDNILVSVSFNNDNETRDVSTRDRRKSDDTKKRKEKKKKPKKDLSGVKPVAIIDLDKSPFRELTPSPKQIIVLTDSDNENDTATIQDNICDSSQQVASPERGIGPKTPPEPQVKFSLTAKQPQVRAISNPLHDPEDMEANGDGDETSSHIGPNTPPEPPNSPPSSPDAYDPFEPTKSRSPTPERPAPADDDGVECRADAEKPANPPAEAVKSLTPPLADVQPADSQSSVQATPDSNLDKSPDIAKGPTPPAQTQTTTAPITSTPISSNSSVPTSRFNLLNSTVITPSTVVSSMPQRIAIPSQAQIKPKISPTKMASSKQAKATRKRAQNGTNEDVMLDFDSPYSPGSSDYEDLFEPPSEIVTKPVIKGKSKQQPKHASSAFDALFGSPGNKPKKANGKQQKKGVATPTKTKTVGVKLDEDNLKILDELPNSAVEMQVKDKFLKKLNRQERVVEEVKLVLKPHYNKKKINKDEYKDIMRRSVPKICHNKSGEINPTKIKNLIEAYVRKIKHSKKVTSSSSINPQKI